MNFFKNFMLLVDLFTRNRKLIFCISMQRNGTTSTGKFLRDAGFRWSGWPQCHKNQWGQKWLDGNIESVFASWDFIRSNAFEDCPWAYLDYFKILYFRYPNAKFIYLSRPLDEWYKSMVAHSNGLVPGTERGHCKIYRRENDFFKLYNKGEIDGSLEYNEETEKTKIMRIDNAKSEQQLKDAYVLHYNEVLDFFKRHNSNRLFHTDLNDKEKWIKMSRFLGLSVPKDYESWENKS
jgi:hypothetical protein